MQSSTAGRIAALAGAAVLAVGGVSLWVSADANSAGATASPAASQTTVAALQEPPEAAFTVQPERPKSREEQRFARADKDDDGRITQAEYLHQRRRNFDKLDLNGDGRLGFEEYAAAGIAKFDQADGNGDRTLIPAEFATTAPKPKNRQTASAEPCRCPPPKVAASSTDEPQD